MTERAVPATYRPKEIPIDELRRVLRYEPETGLFFRRTAHWQYPTGSLVGSLSKGGYLRFNAKGNIAYLLHRLAWAFVYNEQPPMRLPHPSPPGRAVTGGWRHA